VSLGAGIAKTCIEKFVLIEIKIKFVCSSKKDEVNVFYRVSLF